MILPRFVIVVRGTSLRQYRSLFEGAREILLIYIFIIIIIIYYYFFFIMYLVLINPYATHFAGIFIYQHLPLSKITQSCRFLYTSTMVRIWVPGVQSPRFPTTEGYPKVDLVGGAFSCPSWKIMEWKSLGFGWHPKKRNGQSNYHPFHGLKPPEIKVVMEKSQEIPMKVDDLGVSICSATSRSSLPADLPRTGPSRECPECLKAGTWEVLHLRSSTPKKELWGPFLY